MGKVSTTIPELDGLLKGGFKEGSVSCIWAQAGIDPSAFAAQIAAGTSKKRKVFYFVNAKSPKTVKEDIQSYGLNSKKINIVDAYSSLVGAKSSSTLVVTNPKDPDQWLDEIKIIKKKIKDHFIIIDSYSTLIDLTEKENAAFLLALKQAKVTALLLFTEWPYKPKTLKELRENFDTVIDLKYIQKGLFSRQYFSVNKGKKGSNQVIPFQIEKPGGVKIFIPKVLVTGPFNAGKTSFIHSCSQKAVSVDRLGTTIALDHGHLAYKSFTVDLFGTPGQQRFDPILKLLAGEALGVIVVVSATDPQGFPRAIQMLEKANVLSLPVVVAANKANLRGALSLSQIKSRMKIKEAEIVPVTAKDLTKVQPGLPCQLKKADLEKVLEALFKKLMEVL